MNKCTEHIRLIKIQNLISPYFTKHLIIYKFYQKKYKKIKKLK
jgi:hypothetical protein